MATVTVSTDPTSYRGAGVVRRLATDSLYLLTGFPLALASFVLLVVGLALSGGLLVTLLGLPVAVGTLVVARWFAMVERARLPSVLGHAVAAPRYRVREGKGLSRMLDGLRDRQRWLDVAHGIAVFPLATATWCIAVAWWAAVLGSITYPVWGWLLPDPDGSLPSLLGLDGYLWELAFYAVVALVTAVTLPFVMRGCAAVQAALGRELLTTQRVTALRQRVDTLTASRMSAATAEAEARRRLERDLHDGPQQRLLRLAMDLSAAERKLAEDPEAARPLVSAALGEARETLDELRSLSRGFAPTVLTDRGLGAALTAVAARSTVPVSLEVELDADERLPAPVEQAAYHAVSEALANVAKHSGARRAEVRVRREDDVLLVDVVDDGDGGAHPAKGHGLAGLSDRLIGLDGHLVVHSPMGGPTRISAVLPCV
jgi:signal transduction histidine kinase